MLKSEQLSLKLRSSELSNSTHLCPFWCSSHTRNFLSYIYIYIYIHTHIYTYIYMRNTIGTSSQQCSGYQCKTSEEGTWFCLKWKLEQNNFPLFCTVRHHDDCVHMWGLGSVVMTRRKNDTTCFFFTCPGYFLVWWLCTGLGYVFLYHFGADGDWCVHPVPTSSHINSPYWSLPPHLGILCCGLAPDGNKERPLGRFSPPPPTPVGWGGQLEEKGKTRGLG